MESLECLLVCGHCYILLRETSFNIILLERTEYFLQFLESIWAVNAIAHTKRIHLEHHSWRH